MLAIVPPLAPPRIDFTRMLIAAGMRRCASLRRAGTDAEVGRDRIEAAAGHDARAGRSRRIFIARHHPLDPRHLAGQVAVIGARFLETLTIGSGREARTGRPSRATTRPSARTENP